MTTKGATEVRNNFHSTLADVCYKNDTCIIRKQGKEVAALIPISELQLLTDLKVQRRKKRLTQIIDEIHGDYSKMLQNLAK